MEPFIGEIRPFPYMFAPRNWAFCQGQILPIAQNTALFSLLGTTYGGNGQTTFALPDLRGRIAVSSGQGPGMSSYSLGQQSGTEQVTLTLDQTPAHTHLVNCSTSAGKSSTPGGNVPAASTGADSVYGPPTTVNLAADTIGPGGGGAGHDNLQPYTVINYCIALQGIFPSRD